MGQTVWEKPLEFKVSKLGMSKYQEFLKHEAIVDRKAGKTTYNADAITLLMRKYPNDPLYPRILEHRKTQKLLSTYVGITLPDGRLHGGMPVGRDGRIHTQYGRDASTLRFTSEDPNLQNLPRGNPKDTDDPVNIIRNLIVAGAGNILYARDFSGIEAVLTGYFALDPRYIRLAKRDVHTYYTVYALYELEGGARIKAADLPDLNWSDERLFPHLEELKKEFKQERNNLYKHLVHAANFMQGAKGAQAKIFSETGVEYPVSTVKRVMDVYYSLFPKIKQWHKQVLNEAEDEGYLRNPFDYIHRFNRPYDYKWEGGVYTRKPGPDANKCIAFKPQSTAVGIITEAILRLYYQRFEDAGQYLRLQVHDELFFETPESNLDSLDRIVKEEMERPVPQLRMPASWGMGDYLNILTEEKKGYRWGTMK
jgi:DNA polymerase-1